MPHIALSCRAWLIAAALLLLAGAHPAVSAQAAGQPARESAVKAAFLFKFGSFVDWPAGTFKGAQDPLVIGVLADDAVADDLGQLTAGRTVEGRPLKIRALHEGEPLGDVRLLFVGRLRPVKLRELIAQVSGPVLVVTQQDGALDAGSVINFVADGARVRFNVSLVSAEARGLRLSARLLAVAQSVDGKPR